MTGLKLHFLCACNGSPNLPGDEKNKVNAHTLSLLRKKLEDNLTLTARQIMKDYHLLQGVAHLTVKGYLPLSTVPFVLKPQHSTRINASLLYNCACLKP